MRVVFFDLNRSLGTLRFEGEATHPVGFEVFPFVQERLRELRARGYRLGVIADTPGISGSTMEHLLRECGLLDLLAVDLLLFSSAIGMTKDTPDIFREALKRVGLTMTPAECAYISEDGSELSNALKAGMRISRYSSQVEALFDLTQDSGRPSISNLAECIDDTRRAILDGDLGPADPIEYEILLQRLEASQQHLPPLYQNTFFTPFMTTLGVLGPDAFEMLLAEDPDRIKNGGVLLDSAHALLQNAETYEEVATDAFSAVISDLYDGFLSAHGRREIKPPDNTVIAPLVKWGRPDLGPYTRRIGITGQLGVRAGVVNLPPSHARRGLMAWAALAHEPAGHDILRADSGLHLEMRDAVWFTLLQEEVGFGLAWYWAERIDEAASDVLGILNMGPAAAMGMLAYLRGVAAAQEGAPRLRDVGEPNDRHPADLLRGYLAAATVRHLSFAAAPFWGNALEDLTEQDVPDDGMLVLADRLVPVGAARRSAAIVARVLATQPMQGLNGHALIEVQDWDDTDEATVEPLRAILSQSDPLPAEGQVGAFAAHVVAAAMTSALQEGADLSLIFHRMIVLLKAMHDGNPSWGPRVLFGAGNPARHMTYISLPDYNDFPEAAGRRYERIAA